MIPKQVLDSFSETLMQDEKILSAQERALLANVLHHARAKAGEDPGTHEAINAVIASAVGETVAQRAFAVLGGSIVERILASGRFGQTDAGDVYSAQRPLVTASGPPVPVPAPGQPQGPHVSFPPTAPGQPGQPQGPHVRTPQKEPRAPQPPTAPRPDKAVDPADQPQGPHAKVDHEAHWEKTVALLERPSRLPARCVVLDEFLAPEELQEIVRFTLENEAAFSTSEVISPVAEGGIVNYEHRRSRVLSDLPHQGLMLERTKSVLPQVVEKLGMEEFTIAGVEAQITASSDGDFFRFHNDNGNDGVASRYLTFVYFFHREPRQFEGGELRIHDARLEGDAYVRDGHYQTIVPQQNQIVFFPCELMHEITPVKCASRLFADSRFTLNGWLRR
jgi:Rps23 Pro-64 3,4-dihydroxylase Tpa1-like proline 4-hydroxylase